MPSNAVNMTFHLSLPVGCVYHKMSKTTYQYFVYKMLNTVHDALHLMNISVQ